MSMVPSRRDVAERFAGNLRVETLRVWGARYRGPPWDTDEIIDDAIGIFGIAEGYLTPLDSDRVAGLRQVGVQVAEGRRIPPSASNRFELRVLWFRKPVHAT